jgi:hypothetical protein
MAGTQCLHFTEHALTILKPIVMQGEGRPALQRHTKAATHLQ